MSIWADTEEREKPIVVGDTKFYIKRELTAGDREDLIDYMGAHLSQDGTALIRMGQMKLVHLALTRIVTADGQVIANPTFEQIRGLKDSIYYPLAQEVAKSYPPLARSLQGSRVAATSKPTPGSRAKPKASLTT